jgi:prepilin peptidase CpaA
MTAALALAVYVAALAAAAASDLVRYEIPPGLCLVLVAAFLWLAPSLPLAAAASHIAAAAAMLAVTALCFECGLMGGGDAKLLAAITLWLGWGNLAAFIVLTALAGALLGLFVLTLRRLLPRAGAGRWYSRVLAPSEGIPYAIAIAASGLVLLPRLISASGH